MKIFETLKGKHALLDPKSSGRSLTEILSDRFEDMSVLQKTIHDLHDPYLLRDMDKAVMRIGQAYEEKQRVIIFGDYDVDGVTATSLLMHACTYLGMQVSYRLPHRIHDGYGLKNKFIDELSEIGVDLIITVDCGSRDKEVVAYACEKGIDIIVTDHHHVPEDMPEKAVAFINPNRPDCPYPYKGLAGAGVAFKLVSALMKKYLHEKEYQIYIRESIDITAIGTVADCMNLDGENRIIVTEGLKQIKNSRSKGIRSIIEDKIHDDLDADIFGFCIGPRLNAAGRMDTPYKAVDLILNNGKNLPNILREIEGLNELRKSKTSEYVSEAIEHINPKDNILIYHSPEIEHGVIGIVAGRLVEKYNTPAIVLVDEGNKLVASCRSPEYCSLVEILDAYNSYFLAYGGHKQAAGFSISKDKFEEFCSEIRADMNAKDFSSYTPQISIDTTLKLDQIGFKLLEQIQQFKPYGRGNPLPILLIEDVMLEGISFLGKGREHIKFQNRYGFKIFGFGFGEYYEILKHQEYFSLICEISEDNWQGKRGIMIRVIDVILAS